MGKYFDPPDEHVAPVSAACKHLPEVDEHKAWAGTRWRIRNRTFAHVLAVEDKGADITVLTFRSSGEELDTLVAIGQPFFRAGWGHNVLGMVIDASTDWDEVKELLTESYCLMAPKKLAAQVDRPAADGDG